MASGESGTINHLNPPTNPILYIFFNSPHQQRLLLSAPSRVASLYGAGALTRRPLVQLVSIQLCWTHDGDTNTWISHVARHKAEEIELSAKHHNGNPTPEYMSFIVDSEALVKQDVAGKVSVKTDLKILKFIHLSLDDTTLTQLCSRCTSLEQIELNDCLIAQATKIQSKLLKRLTMIKCKIPKGLLSVDAPNLVSLQFSSNFGYVSWIQNLGLLAASNVNQRVTHKYPYCFGLGSCNLEILKLSCVKLDHPHAALLGVHFFGRTRAKDCLAPLRRGAVSDRCWWG